MIEQKKRGKYNGSEYALKSEVPAAVSVVNNLTSTSTTSALSAAQGKALNDGKFDKSGGTISGTVAIDTINTKSTGNAIMRYVDSKVRLGSVALPLSLDTNTEGLQHNNRQIGQVLTFNKYNFLAYSVDDDYPAPSSNIVGKAIYLGNRRWLFSGVLTTVGSTTSYFSDGEGYLTKSRIEGWLGLPSGFFGTKTLSIAGKWARTPYNSNLSGYGEVVEVRSNAVVFSRLYSTTGGIGGWQISSLSPDTAKVSFNFDFIMVAAQD